jgi:hypothetical protein
MKRKVRLTESDLHNIIKESVKTIFEDGEHFNVNLKNSVNESNNIWNKSDGVVGQNLNVTYEDVRNVYSALYGYENYDGNEEDFENGLEEWWDTILSNARRKNQKYTTLPLNKRQRQIIRKRNNK